MRHHLTPPRGGEPASLPAPEKGTGVRLHLIRHPRPAVAEGICYGRTDLGLAEDAAVAARALAPFLPAGVPLFSSPLARCRQLAVALHAAPRIDERLVEMDFGSWEGQAWAAIGRAELDAWAADPLGFAPPGGESAGMLLERARAFRAGLAAGGIDEAVVVTHAGMIKAFHGLLDGLPPSRWMRLSFEFASLTTLTGRHD